MSVQLTRPDAAQSNGSVRSSGSPIDEPSRRRPPALVVGALLAVAAFVGFVVLTPQVPRSRPVLVMRHTVAAGSTITAGDLAVVSVALPAGVAAVPVAAEAQMVGARARGMLRAGQLVSPGSYGPAVSGLTQVGVVAKAGEYPPGLAAGDRVTAVWVAANTANPPTQPGGTIAQGTVESVRSSAADPDTLLVGLAVTAAQANVLANLAAQGQVALVRN